MPGLFFTMQVPDNLPCIFFLSDPAGARTQDPILKRDVLYQLSY